MRLYLFGTCFVNQCCLTPILHSGTPAPCRSSASTCHSCANGANSPWDARTYVCFAARSVYDWADAVNSIHRVRDAGAAVFVSSRVRCAASVGTDAAPPSVCNAPWAGRINQKRYTPHGAQAAFALLLPKTRFSWTRCGNNDWNTEDFHTAWTSASAGMLELATAHSHQSKRAR